MLPPVAARAVCRQSLYEGVRYCKYTTILLLDIVLDNLYGFEAQRKYHIRLIFLL
jgi:hypothetical protein